MRWPQIRALVWKEWREVRAVALTAVLVTAVMPLLLLVGLVLAGAERRVADVATLWPLANWILVCPLIAVAAPAAVLTAEHREARLAFLLSRPISRRAILAVKLSVAAGVCVGVILLGQLVVSAAVPFFVPGGPSDMARGLGIRPAHLGSLGWAAVVAYTATAFAISAFLAILLRRGLHVLFLSLLTATAICGVTFALGWHIDYYPMLGAWTLVQVGVVVAALLAASFVLLGRGELLRGPQHVRRAVLAAVAVVCAWLGVTAPYVAWQMRLPSGAPLLQSLAASADGSTLALTVARPDRAASRTVAVLTQAGGLELVDRRLTTNPALAPDGRRLAYVAMSNQFGFRSSVLSLYVVDRQTGRERLLARVRGRRFGEPGLPVFSPDGRHVAIDLHDTLVIADADGSGPFRSVSRGQARSNVWSCHLHGWDYLSGQAMQICGTPTGDAMRWLDPATGEVVERFDGGGATRINRSWPPSVRNAVVLRRMDDSGAYTWTVLDLASRKQLVLLERANAYLGNVATSHGRASSPERVDRLVAYTRRLSDDRREVRVRWLDTGREEPLQVFESSWVTLKLSPDGRWLVMRAASVDEGSDPEQYVYDTVAGVTTELPATAMWTGWTEAWRGGPRLAYLSRTLTARAAERTLAGAMVQGWARSVMEIDLRTGEQTVLLPQ